MYIYEHKYTAKVHNSGNEIRIMIWVFPVLQKILYKLPSKDKQQAFCGCSTINLVICLVTIYFSVVILFSVF